MNQAQPLRELPLLNIEDAEFVYRTNFAGEKKGPYDEEGERYFNVKVPVDIANALADDGWNVKWTKPGANHPNPEEHVSEPYVVVAIGYKFRAPQVVLIRKGSDGKENPTFITERTIGTLDNAEFEKVDVVIRARRWEGAAGSGYKAWLAEFYGHVNMSDIGAKYAHLLEAPAAREDEDNEG